MRKNVLSLLILSGGLALLTGCASLRGIPEWIDSYPTDRGYFIGIGSSNTGIKAEDMELARAKALASLAASISTTIQSEQTYTTLDTSTGEGFESAEIIIRERVDQNLEAVEVYDSFYSESEGYWFYLRIHKGRWAAIQQEDMAKVIQRVLSVIEPYLAPSGGTIAQKLASLGAGWEIVTKSPYAGLLETTLEGHQVILIDYIENRIGSILQDTVIDSGGDERAVPAGSALPISIQVYSDSGITPGKLPVIILQKQPHEESGEQFVEVVVTDVDGRYQGELNTNLLDLGEHTFTIALGIKKLGIQAASFKNKVIIPSRDVRIEVQNLTALLITRTPEGAGIPGIDESIISLLTGRLPFDLTLDRNVPVDYTIKFSLIFRDAPENDFGLFISFCRAAISLVKNGSTVYSFETEEFKEGGLDYDQAHQRAANALFSYLQEDRSFAARMTEVLHQ